MSGAVAVGGESGDRHAFLGRLRTQLARGVPANPAHPLPGSVQPVPTARSSMLSPHDLLGSFVRNAEALRVDVHVTHEPEVPDDVLAALVERHAVRRAVVSREPEAQAVGARLAQLGVDVAPVSVAASADAQLGITAAAAAVATTGSVLQDSSLTGGRTASLLPPAHLCVVPARRIVPGTEHVLRSLGERHRHGGGLPANLVLVTGPSRSGDIEQIIALGVHGPVALTYVVIGAPAP